MNNAPRVVRISSRLKPLAPIADLTARRAQILLPATNDLYKTNRNGCF
jgi:hypothetical protein